MLKIICVYEVHQFVSFVCSFWKEICNLKNRFFDKIKATGNKYVLRIPLLLMTVTMTIDIVQQFEQITCLVTNTKNYIWANADEISQHHISINFDIVPSHAITKLQNILKYLLEKHLYKKVIVYTNTTRKAEELKEKVDNYLDNNPSIKGNYTMLIYVDMYADVNFLSTVKFTTKESNPKQLLKNK